LLYPFTKTGFSPDCLNNLLKLSLAAFLELVFSFENIHSTSSKFPSDDTESRLSVFALPPIKLALVCNVLVSPICHHTMTMTCALASLLFPLAIACTLYIPGERKV